MDIAIVGPEKFAFQDIACIDLALSYRSFGPFTLVAEPKGGEDAILTWNGAAAPTLEVQVKGAKGTAGIVRLTDYLTHYPPREAHGCLLQRLMERHERNVLFILTARCKDELTPLLLTHPLVERPMPRNVPPDLVEALREEIRRRATANPPKTRSQLSLARLRDLEALAKRPITDFEGALAKTKLVEQETAETIEIRLHAALQAERFDTLSIRGILARLSDLLAKSKRHQSDALAPMLQELAQSAPSALRPDAYFERGIEEALEKHLYRERSLLLAGPPRAGKSWTARAIAGRLQSKGYEARQGPFVEEAERFLTDPTGPERVYVLDDPIGSREPCSNASGQLAALGALCERIPSNRRLIIAQSEQVLLQTRGAPNLAACALQGRAWRRLEPLPRDKAESIWRSFAAAQSVAMSGIAQVAKLIANDPGLRDPGALAYLAQTWSELPEDPLDEEILLQARRDASDFARALAMQTLGVRDLLTASALATTASDGATTADLAFIINGDQDRPSSPPEFPIFSVGDDPRPPAYASEQLLNNEQEHALDTLQRRRVIEDQDSRFNFTHPYLRAGAQTLVSPDIQSDLQRVLTQLERAIACPSPVTSLASARNLRWMRLALQRNGVEAVFNVARKGARSLFPATRDCCFEFLIQFADVLPDELRKNLPRLSELMVIDLGHINTAHGVGFISNQYDWVSDPSPLEEVQPFLDAIEHESPLGLDLSLSRRILQSLDEHAEALTAAAARRFLRADEAVVRAAAARLWIGYPREDDEDILARLKVDATPAMSTALLKGLTYRWERLSESRRERVLTIIGAHARSPSCATVLFNRLVLFNRPEHFGKQPPWPVFTTLMPIVIANLPLSVSFANGRLSAGVDDAMQAVSAEALIPLLDAWAKRLLQRIGRYILTDFELAIVEPLLGVATADMRLPILRNLLNVRDTGARVTITRWLAESWDALALSERHFLQKALAGGRDDARWLSATVLTRRHPPLALIAVLTGEPGTLELSTESIEQKLGAPLFAACVHMFAGWPQPLWWYDTHHSSNANWSRVIRDLARNPDHPLHAIAFYEMANWGEDNEFAELVDKLPAPALQDTFERLLDFKLAHTGDWRRKAWRKLFARAEHMQMIDDFIKRIDDVLDGILEGLEDIENWLGDGDLVTRVLRLLPDDLRAVEHARNLQTTYIGMKKELAEKKDPNEGILKEIFAKLCAKELEALEAAPPRIFGCWNEIGYIFKSVGASSETLAVIEAKRSAALKRHQAIRARFRGSPEPVQLDGWIDRVHMDS